MAPAGDGPKAAGSNGNASGLLPAYWTLTTSNTSLQNFFRARVDFP